MGILLRNMDSKYLAQLFFHIVQELIFRAHMPNEFLYRIDCKVVAIRLSVSLEKLHSRFALG